MKTLIPVIILTTALVGGARAEAEEVQGTIVPSGRVDLFNGKDLSGWTFCLRDKAAPEATWSVTNGVIRCTGQPFGYARTEKGYRDYQLTVEWRFVDAAQKTPNSGIFVHVQPPDTVWPKCIECQGMSGHQGDVILMGGATCKGHESPEARFVGAVQPSNEKPLGEWNTYRILCSGSTVTLGVNGKRMNEVTDCSVSAGAIAIQSEGAELEVRGIYLEPLAGGRK